MATLEQLGSLPPVTAELDLFDYVPLDSRRTPPAIELRARLARSFDAEDDGEGLRLAFVAGRPVDSYDLIALAYIWRSGDAVVAWGVERWSSPERRLRPYRNDATFAPRAAADVHAELRELGVSAVARQARDLLES